MALFARASGVVSALFSLLLTLSSSPSQAAMNPSGVIPVPVNFTLGAGTSFTLMPSTVIYVSPPSPSLFRIAHYLSDRLAPATGWRLHVKEGPPSSQCNAIFLSLSAADPALGEEGYTLQISDCAVLLQAIDPPGIFRGIQTIRQLFPPSIEMSSPQPGPFTLPASLTTDYPRFPYRSAMLDIARHFFTVADVKRHIDNLAYYKVNSLHLHLTDDQGWRIVIHGYPNLTEWGSGTEVYIPSRMANGNCPVAGSGEGPCYYTQEQYEDIVSYASDRYMLVVPEADMPGHTNAALASYCDLNCDGICPSRRTDTAVGYSTLCVTQPIPQPTVDFMNTVIDQLCRLTPGILPPLSFSASFSSLFFSFAGPFVHVGGDESNATPLADYKAFVSLVQSRVLANGKRMMGWEETAQIDNYSPLSIAQHWNIGDSFAPLAVQKGAKVLMSPCQRAYFDIKYSPLPGQTPAGLGLSWCGYDSVEHSYSWDPATNVEGVSESDIIGVEAPLWTETVLTNSDIDQMVWPRMAGMAEIGWSPQSLRNWNEYRSRLGTHGPRLTNMGVNYFPASDVPWTSEE
jgi:hexosaminidase